MGVMSKNAFILSRLWSLSPQVTRLYTPFPVQVHRCMRIALRHILSVPTSSPS